MAALYTYVADLSGSGQQNSRWGTREKCVMTFGSVSILLSIVAISAMTILIFMMQESKAMEIHQTKENPIACITCTNMRQGKDNNMNCTMLAQGQGVKELKDEAERWCAYNPEQMSTLFQLVMLNQVGKQGYIPSDLMFSLVSAHKRLLAPSTDRDITAPYFEAATLVQAQFSEQSDPLIEHVRGVEVSKACFHILYSGLYLVYSSLLFNSRSSHPCKDFKYNTWIHYVEKFVMNFPGSSGFLMKAFHTCCDECTNDHETSFLNGAFQLKKGDMIRVNISGHGLVLFQKESSFAGLVMLRSDNDEQNLPNA